MKNTKIAGVIAGFAVMVMVFVFAACSLETKEETVPGKSFADKVQWLRSNADSRECYVLELGAGRESAGPVSLPSGYSVRIRGVGSSPTVIELSGSGSLFTVSSGCTLVLDKNVSLAGRSSNTSALVKVDGGRLIMKAGSKISGNGGRGVSVASSYSRDDGTFIMNGGEISGNTGGGVSVGENGTFRMVNGTIYGSDAGEGLSNTADTGAALSVSSGGAAQRGTFEGETWTGKGTLGTTSNTIWVVNGEVAGIGSITAPVWDEGAEVTLAAPTVTVPPGQTAGAKGWQTSANGSTGWTDFDPPAIADMSSNGKYLRYYAVSGDQTFYSNVVQIKVISATAREITVDMFDSAGDGWGSGALRINVNGTNLASNIRVSDGYSGTYTFMVEKDDVVQWYWVGGSDQSENSFIAYYSDTPPDPAFTASNNGSWNGANALVYRLRDTLNSTSGGTLLGSVTVTVDVVGGIAAPVWTDGSAVSMSGPKVVPPAGQTITARGWESSDDGGYWTAFTPPAIADMSYDGIYLRYYAATSDGETYYSNTVSIRVTQDMISPTGIELVRVPGGSFQMGSASGGDSDERPVHTVTVSTFYMGKYEVTQGQYRTVMGSNPSSGYGTGDNYPVYYVSWYDAVEFCNALSVREGLQPVYTISGSTVTVNWNRNGYRLPTEAEWEYAAKGGDGSPGNYLYSGSNNAGEVAWYWDNSSSGTKQVGTKAPNGLGIYDMSGNVWEWCWDWYGSYTSGEQSDPCGAVSGTNRVGRGGSWYGGERTLRSVYRGRYAPSYQYYFLGFRLVRR